MLGGLRVVEVGQYVAAPLAATIFADLGATVVKVERPGGDPLRADPARFAAWNRGKETIELDLRSPAGAAALRDLVDEADLLIENLRPGALDRLGLAPATLAPADPVWSPAPSPPGVLTGRHATSRDGSRSCTPGRARNRGCSPGTIRSGSPSLWPASRRRWWPSSVPEPH